jgi:hypothetical protein
MERQVRRPIYGPGNARLLELRGIYISSLAGYSRLVVSTSMALRHLSCLSRTGFNQVYYRVA